MNRLNAKHTTMHCLIIDDDPISRMALQSCAERSGRFTDIREYPNPSSALNHLKEKNVDLLFLNVEMPGMNGLEFLETIENRPAVVLVSANPNYAVNGFELSVNDFLLKPVKYARFEKCVNKVIEKSAIKDQENAASNVVFFKVDGVWLKINKSDISYIQAMADYVLIYVNQGESVKRHIVHATMKAMEERLGVQFSRIHRSYLINKSMITGMTSNSINIGDKQIPVGVTYQKVIDQLLK